MNSVDRRSQNKPFLEKFYSPIYSHAHPNAISECQSAFTIAQTWRKIICEKEGRNPFVEATTFAGRLTAFPSTRTIDA
jgi:hypothetical protein